MMIATGFGLSLLVTAWMFYRVTGGLFKCVSSPSPPRQHLPTSTDGCRSPAITVALWITGVLTTTRAALLFVAQLVGGIVASALVLALTPQTNNGVDGVRTTVSPQVSYQQAFVLEMLGTSVLVFSVLMLAVEKVRVDHSSTDQKVKR